MEGKHIILGRNFKAVCFARLTFPVNIVGAASAAPMPDEIL